MEKLNFFLLTSKKEISQKEMPDDSVASQLLEFLFDHIEQFTYDLFSGNCLSSSPNVWPRKSSDFQFFSSFKSRCFKMSAFKLDE